MTRRWKYALFSLLVCSGCTIGPKYQRPTAPATPAFKELNGNDQWKMATPSDQLLKGKWWEIFNDPELNRLEELVDINNQNVKQAEAQFRQARALVAGNYANYLSDHRIESIHHANRQRQERWPWAGRDIAIVLATGDRELGTGFVGPRSPVRRKCVGQRAGERGGPGECRLSAQALLATDYFIMVGNDMQQAILADTIQAYQKNLQLTINRFNGGVASRSDITLAQTQLAGAQAQSTDLRIARAQLEHAIAVLTGQAPSSVELPTAMIAAPPPPIPLALPSTLLERRPDIAANERLVAAANANIGIAQTAYYPTLTLSATPGLLSTSLATLFTWGSRVWSAGPSISQTLFDFGRRNAQVQGAQAAYDATVAAYRQTVLSAFQEVEDDLAALRYLAEEAGQQQEAVVAAEQALVLENARYLAGTDSYLNVITTQTIELTDKQASVTILQRRMLAAVDLVKALGGGWDASTLPSTDQLRSAELANPNNTQKVAQPTAR